MGKSQAKELIQSSVAYIEASAARLMASQFSASAIERFRSNVSGTLKRSSGALVAMAWIDGNGKGEAPFRIAGEYIDEQLHFLANWLADIESSGAMQGGVGRAQMYAESLGQVYQRAYFIARGSRAGLPDLPHYPRDGSTKCLTHCRCQWQIKKVTDMLYHAFWKLGQAEHCEDCVERGRTYSPLTLVFADGDWRMIASGRTVPEAVGI